MPRTATTKSFQLALLATVLSFSLGVPGLVLAQQPGGPPPAAGGAGPEGAGVESYWTPERLQGARPPQLPAPDRTGPQGLPEGAELEAPQRERPPRQPESTKPAEQRARPPAVPRDSSLERQLMPEVQQSESVGPEAVSSFGAFFTTSRVFPDAATTAYPYSTVGKLFFHDPRRNTDHVCSASVIRPRIVATAGHCVSNPSTNPTQRYFFTNFMFAPAFNNGAAPFGTWTSGQQWVLDAWHHSDGSVPNSGDVALLVINDRNVGGQTRKIGEITGMLGHVLNALSKNHLTLLGYPCNLDSCARMQITAAGSFASGGNNTFIYGSASRGGHSGGPWIQDFGVRPSSNPGLPLGLNLLVGITSYGPTATEPKYLGASNLNSSFTNMLNKACVATTGNC